MVSQPSDFWKSFLTYCRHNIYKNLKDAKTYPDLIEDLRGTIVRKTVGPIALSSFISTSNIKVEILPANLFNNSDEICFTKHHQTGIWGFID